MYKASQSITRYHKTVTRHNKGITKASQIIAGNGKSRIHSSEKVSVLNSSCSFMEHEREGGILP